MTQDGRHATQPYRVRAGSVWYWVDPTVPREAIRPGDTVVAYPACGEAVVAALQRPPGGGTLAFASPQGERFEVAARDIAALHLAAVDDVQ
ncbi:MAG: hypothetical protein QOG38_3066 [Hyphomicrobiales bacterium]|jgi:hypothetical protein|nr:hypothetical protein [Hyphomicrobiales bacterium]